MASVTDLKGEIKLVERVLRHNQTLVIKSLTTDEFTCRFHGKEGKGHDITAHFTDSYPQTPPVWYADTDNVNVTQVIEQLSTTSGQENHVVSQVRILLEELCRLEGIPVPKDELEQLNLEQVESASNSVSSTAADIDSEEEMDVPEEDDDDDEAEVDNQDFDDYEIDLVDDVIEDKESEKVVIDPQHQSTLDRLEERFENRKKNLKGQGQSIESSKRLMKELKDVYQSESFKNGAYNVELVNDSLYEWNIQLREVDKDSPLHKDMMTLKQREGCDHIQFNMTFRESYPFEPPFVRVVHPMIERGHVTIGGAVCMELLTKQGWTAAYTVETVILQLQATLVAGGGRIQFGVDPKIHYTAGSARASYENMVRVHGSQGWGASSKD